MSDFFSKISKDVTNIEQEMLGPDYKYHKQIKTPSQLGVNSRGTMGAMAKNIGGIVNYVELLVSGTGPGSTTGQPLGNQFFLKTGWWRRQSI